VFLRISIFLFLAGIPILFPRNRAVVSLRLFSSPSSRFALGGQQFRVVLLARSCDLSRRDTPTLVRFVCFRARNSLCLVPAFWDRFVAAYWYTRLLVSVGR
jgi:hypothetical protein